MESYKPPTELSGIATDPSASVKQALLFPQEKVVQIGSGFERVSHETEYQAEHVTVETTFGPIEFAVQGDLKRPAIITWAQAGLDRTLSTIAIKSHVLEHSLIDHQCFRNFFTQPGAERLVEIFSIVHMQAPGLVSDGLSLQHASSLPTHAEQISCTDANVPFSG
jgi:hypothetical protein